MSFTLGVFDLFTYAAPGSLYLALITYIAARLGWLDPSQIVHANTTLVIIIGTIASYLLGHITYMAGRFLLYVSPWRRDIADARHEFAERVPAAMNRPFLTAHSAVLRAAIELHEINAASEIARLQAVGLMLRNSAPPLILGAVAAVANAATNTHPVLSIYCAIILPIAAAGCLFQSARMSYWSYAKTLELAFWVPGIDDGLRTQTATGKTSPVQRPANRTVTQTRRTKRMPSRGNNQGSTNQADHSRGH